MGKDAQYTERTARYNLILYMKKIYQLIIALIVILILVLAADLIMNNAGEEKPSGNGNQTGQETAEDAIEVSVATVNQKDSFYNIQAEYPQFKGADESFNQKISDLVTGQIETFKKDAKDNWEARRATATPENPIPENPTEPFDFIETWTSTQINDRYISFLINIYYFSGGAHGLTQLYAFNYDVEKNKEITINDFLGSSDGLEKLSNLAIQAATAELQSVGLQLDDNTKQMLQEGTKPTEDNYKNFNFDYDSIIIYFQQYQIAPGYLGPVPITLHEDMLINSGINSGYWQ